MSASAPRWAIACDFDGTITVGDFTDRLLERHAPDQWREIEADWRAGRIGSRECMLRQIDLVRCTPRQLAELIAETEIERGFIEFVSFVRGRGIPLRIVSDGLDVAIAAILAQHKIEGLPVFANRLSQIGPERFRIAFPGAREDCPAASGLCKCALVGAGPHRATRTLLIGDGASDFCAAQAADYVLAKGRLAEHCRRNNIAFAPFGDFHEVRRLVAALLDDGASDFAATPTIMNQENLRHESQ